MNFYEEILKSARNHVIDGLAIKGDIKLALEYAKEKSCAGKKIWEILEREFSN